MKSIHSIIPRKTTKNNPQKGIAEIVIGGIKIQKKKRLIQYMREKKEHKKQKLRIQKK